MPSSVIRSVRYDPERRLLDILFTTGRRYHYRDVPPFEAESFRAAFNKGRYFNAHIRDAFRCSEVEA